MDKFYKNTIYEVLTKEGFKKFHGIKETVSKGLVISQFNNGKIIKCTEEHQIATTNGYKEAKDISRADEIITQSGTTTLFKKVIFDIPSVVYDLCEVADTHSFFANDILISNCILLDEFAFVPHNIAQEFYTSVYPTITSGQTTKLFMVSTPKGMNLFYKFWTDAVAGRNSFVPTEGHWSEVPGRDEKWKQETINNIGEQAFAEEFECVAEDTVITVQNIETKEITHTTIGKLYLSLSENS